MCAKNAQRRYLEFRKLSLHVIYARTLFVPHKQLQSFFSLLLDKLFFFYRVNYDLTFVVEFALVPVGVVVAVCFTSVGADSDGTLAEFFVCTALVAAGS
jgi:hypothetical protein